MTTFSGFGENAPLELEDLSGEALAGIEARLSNGTADAFADAAAAARYCSHPIRLVGSSTTVDARTGEVLGEFSSSEAPLGQLFHPCGNRRADVCPSCSRLYARDTFEVIRTGVLGGKSVPDTVAAAPLIFVTLTAPSFGHVHGVRPERAAGVGGRCRPGASGVCTHGRPRFCSDVHAENDPVLGSPLCSDCYDWSSAVVWQWFAPELWRRFTIALRRHLSAMLGVRESSLRERAAIQFAKVAEFQARGLVHFHSLIRLDGPDGQGSRAPISGARLAELVREVAPLVEVTAPPVDNDDVRRVLRFGVQLDVKLVRTGFAPSTCELGAEQVAGYLAKYSTKGTGDGAAGRRPHLARLRRECSYLAARAATACRPDGFEPEDVDSCVCGLCRESVYYRLGKWAHMLGFRGHFSTKSRRYSVTLGILRRARARYQRIRSDAERRGRPSDTHELEAQLLADDETTLVIGSWIFQGVGWTNPGDKELADAAAARAREYAHWKSERRGRLCP